MIRFTYDRPEKYSERVTGFNLVFLTTKVSLFETTFAAGRFNTRVFATIVVAQVRLDFKINATPRRFYSGIGCRRLAMNQCW